MSKFPAEKWEERRGEGDISKNLLFGGRRRG